MELLILALMMGKTRKGANLIQPTVLGRIVWYRDLLDDELLAAIVVKVVDDEHVNLAVFSSGGALSQAHNVRLLQDSEPMPGECTWIPYLKAQAAKNEVPPVLHEDAPDLLPLSGDVPMA